MHYGRNRNFLAYEEAAEWFDTHDMADYEDQLTSVDVEFDLRENRNWVEVDFIHDASNFCRSSYTSSTVRREIGI
jgi:hypothetical protein